jgi:hypothetical protein
MREAEAAAGEHERTARDATTRLADAMARLKAAEVCPVHVVGGAA